jgi:pimeloyl-ACP methyl ester carboxylesterase
VGSGCTSARAPATRPIARGAAARSPVSTTTTTARRARLAVSAASAEQSSTPSPAFTPPPRPWTERTWTWRGHAVRWVEAGPPDGPAVILTHGFGASCDHWRFNFRPLAEAGYRVLALDLLGFGASAKPDVPYSIDLWRDQLLDFVAQTCPAMENGPRPRPVLVGNSLGSLVALSAASSAPPATFSGLVCLNLAGGMNSKARGLGDDWRLQLARPIFALIDFLLSIKPLARRIFDGVRSPENLKGVLASVYRNQAAVDDDLVDLIARPAGDPGALAAFITIITGDPGPKPQDLMPGWAGPLLFIWGDADPFTPVDGPVGKWCASLPATRPGTAFELLPDVGHCPHDDRPEAVHARLLPWLKATVGAGEGEGRAAAAGAA